MLDLLIRGGSVIDGTGSPSRRADVGLRDGRIVVVGDADESAAETVDADGLVVCPGFVDVHTHYDAQIMWDPCATPSSVHGVTTVIGGNCGFGIAPMTEGAADYLARMLAVVEGIPLAALRAGVAWDWSTFGEWLERLDGHVGVNAGFLVGHSVLRRVVLGDASGSPADEHHIEQMVALLHESLAAGGLGFSSSWAPTHVDGDGEPVPSRAADAGELLALATAAGRHPGTTLAFIPGLPPFSADQTQIMIAMSKAADRPLNWNTFRVSSGDEAVAEQHLAASTDAQADGACVVGLAYPALAEFLVTFASTVPLTGLPDWSATMRLERGDRMHALRDPDTRARLELGATRATGQLANVARWEQLVVLEAFSAANEPFVGLVVREVADRRGVAPFDAVLDLALADDLRTVFAVPPAGDDDDTWQLRSRYWGDPRTVVGGSDAGADLDAVCGARYTTDFIGPSVRDRQLLSLEHAVQQLTDVPARVLGLRDRGRIAEGAWGDVVVFDPTTVAPGPVYVRDDLPGGASRLYSDAVGVAHVFVNGVEVARDNVLTGAEPGKVLRSGDDLSTVTSNVPGERS